jgi:hypothetical protein
MPEGFSGKYALEGFSFHTVESRAGFFDVQQHAGITFWATAKGADGGAPPPPIVVAFPDFNTDTEHASTCIQGAPKDTPPKENCNAFRKPLALSDQWQKFTVLWSELAQADGFGQPFPQFDTRVYSVVFEALGEGPKPAGPAFEFCVSQIRFTD